MKQDKVLASFKVQQQNELARTSKAGNSLGRYLGPSQTKQNIFGSDVKNKTAETEV
jgi:hypothetical protein